MRIQIKHSNISTLTLLLLGLYIFPTISSAALISRLNGAAVYDTDMDITWLADANYANTSGYHHSGYMNWTEAGLWIDSLNASNHLNYSDWRLPTVDVACSYPFTCNTSELGHLYLDELGGILTAGTYIGNYSNDPDLALFNNIQEGLYWAGTLDQEAPSKAYIVDTRDGFQISIPTYNPAFVLAVRDGDVTAVPAPAAVWLFGSGLLCLANIARRKKA